MPTRPAHDHLAQFIRAVTILLDLLDSRLEFRKANLRALADRHQPTVDRWEYIEGNIIEGLQVVYVEGRRLALEPAPAPLISGFTPREGEDGDGPAVDRVRDTLTKLLLDARAREPPPVPEARSPAGPPPAPAK